MTFLRHTSHLASQRELPDRFIWVEMRMLLSREKQLGFTINCTEITAEKLVHEAVSRVVSSGGNVEGVHCD